MLEEGYKDEMLFISSKLVIKMFFFCNISAGWKVINKATKYKRGKKKEKKKPTLLMYQLLGALLNRG